MADLIELFRGQNWLGPSNYLKAANQGLPEPSSGLGLTKKELSKLAGQYWTKKPSVASSYAGPSGQIRSMKVPSDYLDKFNKFQKKVVNLPSGKFSSAAAGTGSEFLVPKFALNKFPSSVNYGQTIKNIGNTINPFKGLIDEAKIIKAGYDLYGPGYALKDLGSHGLGFLKNNAFRTLKMLGSLQGQAGIMALSPTMMGNAELPQMPQGSPTQINQGGGNGGGGYQPTTTAQNRARTASRVGPGGNVKAYGLADGGLIDLYRYGGFI